MSTLYAIGKDIIGTQYSPNPNSNSVSVVADGTKTYATLLNELYNLIDYDRVTNNSVVTIGLTHFNLYMKNDAIKRLQFTTPFAATGGAGAYGIGVSSDTSLTFYNYAQGSNNTDIKSDVPASGTTITLYYNDQPSYTTSMLADNVKYDNTQSGLSATETQSAIDEVVGDLKKNTTIIGSNVGTIPTSGYLEVTAPYDGYIKLQSTSTSSIVMLNLTGSSGGDTLYAVATSQGWGLQVMSVRKGQKLYLTATGDNSKVSAKFVSYS